MHRAQDIVPPRIAASYRTLVLSLLNMARIKHSSDSDVMDSLQEKRMN
jgi:hypothetical protein